MRSPTQLPSNGNECRALPVALLALLLFVGAGSVGCSDPETPAGGGGSAGLSGAAFSATAGAASSAGVSSGGTAGTGSAGTAGGSAIEASFNTLKSLIPTHCFGGLCHDLPENPLHLTVNDELYTTLTTHVTKHCGPLLKAGSPQDSALVKLLKGPCGETERMPFGKCFADGDEGCVLPDDIAAIEQWIAKGAPQ